MNGHLDVCSEIVKQSRKIVKRGDRSDAIIQYDEPENNNFLANNSISIFSNLNWSTGIAAALVYERFEILKLFEHEFDIMSPRWGFFSTALPFLEFCFKIEDGSKYYELILKLTGKLEFKEAYRERHLWKDLLNSCEENQHEYAQVISKYILDIRKHPYFLEHNEFDWNDCQDHEAMKAFITLFGAANDKEQFKIALKFAFSMGFEKEFQSLFDQTKWSERDLLDLFHVRLFRPSKRHENENLDIYERLIKLILNRLDAQKPILENDFETLLSSLLNIQQKELFEFIWNEKRVVRTPKWTNDFVLHNFSRLNDKFLKFLLPYCDFSQVRQFNKNFEFSFGNICALKLIEQAKWRELNFFKELFQIKWTCEFLEFALKDGQIAPIAHWLLKQPDIQTSNWSKKAIQLVLVYSCKNAIVSLFELLLAKFPNFDLRTNNDELLHAIVPTGADDDKENRYILMSKLLTFSTFRFNDERERNDIMYLISSKEFNSIPRLIELCKKVKVLGK